ncbi:MAG: hypothetical protein PUE12_14260 [Oscillospiraceae bacterium]|nr:hypothetical protein [Oscillospiraceae bacterium]
MNIKNEFILCYIVGEGGYGKPPENKNGSDLSRFLKVRLKSAGLRVVYKVVRQDDKMFAKSPS